MFDVEYKGGNSVVIATKKSTLAIDPRLSVVGLKEPKLTHDVELATEARLALGEAEGRVLIEGPGEYEVGDFTIRGVAATRHIDTPEQEKIATLYRVEVGDCSFAVVGNVASEVSEEQLEALGVVDIVILPVGGNGYTLDATSAVALVRQIDPKVVIPVHYADSGLKYEVPQDSLEQFTKELGAPVETVQKWKVKSSSAIPQALTVVEITRS